MHFQVCNLARIKDTIIFKSEKMRNISSLTQYLVPISISGLAITQQDNLMSAEVLSTPDFVLLGSNEHTAEPHQRQCLQAKHFPFDLKEEGRQCSGLTV